MQQYAGVATVFVSCPCLLMIGLRMNRRRAWIAIAVALACFLLLPVGCKSQPGTAPTRSGPVVLTAREAQIAAKRGPQVSGVQVQPALRIRLTRGANTVQLSGASLTLGPGYEDTGHAQARRFTGPLTIQRERGGFVITDANANVVRWSLRTLLIQSTNAHISVGNQTYPGSIELVALEAQASRFDIVNHVGMEDYLPGVLSKELYPGWHPEAYRAQAIAARSYAIWEMNLPRRRQSHFDLIAGAASQAYTANVSDKARDAVRATHGLVLVFEHRVLPAFYSSSTGGVGQDAVAAFPGRVDDLAPLRGRNHGTWGSGSTKYTWGPVVRDRRTLSLRIAAWGKATDHTIAGLGTIRHMQIATRNHAGRPNAYFVDDDKGLRYTIASEHLRNAINFTTSAAGGAVPADRKLYSSNLSITITGNQIRFTGRGYGHGVGMGQWGAQEMAQAGYEHRAILGFYYPGTAIQRAY